MNVLQRSVEILCKGVTNGGVITGEMFVGGGAQKRDFSLEMVGAGLAAVDQRKIDYGEASKTLIDAQNCAIANKVGIWSLHQEKKEVCNMWCNLQIIHLVKAETKLTSLPYHIIRPSPNLYRKQRKRPQPSKLVKFVVGANSSSMLLAMKLPVSSMRVCASLRPKMELGVLLAI